MLGPALAEAAVQPQPEAALAAADDERVRAGAHDVAVLPRPLVHLHTVHSFVDNVDNDALFTLKFNLLILFND